MTHKGIKKNPKLILSLWGVFCALRCWLARFSLCVLTSTFNAVSLGAQVEVVLDPPADARRCKYLYKHSLAS